MSSLINLKRGNRSVGLLGWDGPEPKFAPDYNYLEIGLGSAYKIGPKGEKVAVTAAAPGDFIKLVPEGTVTPHDRNHALVVVNGVLSAYGSVSYQTILAPGDTGRLGASFFCQEAIDLTQLPWLFRAYALD